MKAIKYFLYLFAAVTTLGVLTACDDDEPTGGDVIVLQKGSGDGAVKGLLEVPELKPSNLFVSHFTKVNGKDVMTYCYEFDRSKFHTHWVAYRFDAITRQRNHSGRSNAWSDDPALPEAYRVGIGYFTPYDRGHLCPSDDRQYSLEANMQTFYMSNMSPQDNNLNAGVWLELEKLVRKCGLTETFADTLYVVKGGTIADGQIRTYLHRSSYMQIAVPKYYFTALLSVKDGSYSSIGFLIEHNSANAGKTDLSEFAMSVDKLETITGINFFSNLPNTTEDAVEASYVFSKWNI